VSAVLAPKLDLRPLGQHWERYSGSSTFGALWRAIRINRLKRSDTRTMLGVSLRRDEDLFERFTVSGAAREALARAYPTRDFEHALATNLVDWWPFGGPVGTDAFTARVRVCRACARYCYHSLLFQVPGVDTCPWHGTPLVDACPRCERPLSMSLGGTARPLGACACGDDPVDEIAALEGDAGNVGARDAAIDEHLARAAQARRETWLLPPEQQDAQARSALTGLAVQRLCRSTGASGSWNGKPGTVLYERVSLERCLQYPAGRLSPVSGLGSFRPDILALPVHWYDAFNAISRELANDIIEPLGARARNDHDVRAALRRLPVHVCNRRLFLQTDCLHRTVLRSASRLSAAIAVNPYRRVFEDDRYVERVRAHTLGIPLIERTVLRLLARGYADGARVVLGRHVPELYDSPRTRPVARFPWVLLSLRPNRLPSAVIAWTRQPALSA